MAERVLCYSGGELRPCALWRAPDRRRRFDSTAGSFNDGPVAQLGARFHGMEEVVSSNLTRSTKSLKHLPLAVERNWPVGVRSESKGQENIWSCLSCVFWLYGTTCQSVRMIDSVDGFQNLAHRGSGVCRDARIRRGNSDVAGLPARAGRRIHFHHWPDDRAVFGLRADRPAFRGKDRRPQRAAHFSAARDGILRGCGRAVPASVRSLGHGLGASFAWLRRRLLCDRGGGMGG